MGLSWNEDKRQWEWEGSVRGLVVAVGDGDARLGFILDKKSGAKISMNINELPYPEATEPFYVESPDGDNLYDAGNRKDAVKLLTNARKGVKRLDDDLYDVAPKHKSSKKRLPRVRKNSATLRGLRR